MNHVPVKMLPISLPSKCVVTETASVYLEKPSIDAHCSADNAILFEMCLMVTAMAGELQITITLTAAALPFQIVKVFAAPWFRGHRFAHSDRTDVGRVIEIR